MLKVAITFSVLLFVSTFDAFGDDNLPIEVIKAEIGEIPPRSMKNLAFKQAYQFFLERNYDSSMVRAYQYLNQDNGDKQTEDYCHYFRGYALMKKELYKSAMHSFSLISPNCSFSLLVHLHAGEMALEQQDYEAALTHFLEAEPRMLKKQINMGILYHNIGVTYLHQEKYDSAEVYLFKGLSHHEFAKDTSHIIGSCLDIANLYYYQYLDSLAIPYFEMGYNLACKFTDIEMKRNSAFNMSIVEENRGNMQKALEYRKVFEKWKDSIVDENRVWEMAESEKQVIANKAKSDIALLNSKSRAQAAQRSLFLFTSIFMFVLTIVFFWFYQVKRKSNRIISEQKRSLNALNATKDQLFSIVGHDLRSSVNAMKRNNVKITENMNQQNYEQVEEVFRSNAEITSTTGNLLDNMLNWAMLQTEQLFITPEPINVSAIIEQVTHNYASLMKEKRIKLSSTMPTICKGYFDIDSLKIILRNLLDNAIKYSDSESNICIYSNGREENAISIIIEDTGEGMSADELNQISLQMSSTGVNTAEFREYSGFGLRLCKMLLERNNGSIQFESEPIKGTKVTLKIPIHE